MSALALKQLNSSKPYIAAQGAMMCVVEGHASQEEASAILKLSSFDDTTYRVAGRTLHDWMLAALDVLGIKKCEEPEKSDVWGLIEMMKDPAWINDMKTVLPR